MKLRLAKKLGALYWGLDMRPTALAQRRHRLTSIAAARQRFYLAISRHYDPSADYTEADYFAEMGFTESDKAAYRERAERQPMTVHGWAQVSRV